MEERLIELFKEYLPAWSWEEWQAAGASDKEDIVINALADLGPDMTIEVDEAYDLFWDWAAGLTETDFGSELKEAVRVVSDPDVLYHATEVGPFYDILNSGVMLHDVRNEGGVHAICFTTDDNYSIYGYPCKIKFSRSKLEQGGYELYPVDEFEDYGEGESEERIDEDINDVRKYVTEVIVDWEFIAVAQDGDDCRLSTGEYDEEGNESDNWDLRLSEFRALLDSLKASGIKVTEKGQPEADDDYWFDETGEFKYGREPALV